MTEIPSPHSAAVRTPCRSPPRALLQGPGLQELLLLSPCPALPVATCLAQSPSERDPSGRRSWTPAPRWGAPGLPGAGLLSSLPPVCLDPSPLHRAEWAAGLCVKGQEPPPSRASTGHEGVSGPWAGCDAPNQQVLRIRNCHLRVSTERLSCLLERPPAPQCWKRYPKGGEPRKGRAPPSTAAEAG